MYTLHIANKNYSSWSLRPWVLMQALDIPFKEILTPFSEDPKADEFKAFCPSGLVPCLEDSDITVWDSLAITEYLAERHMGVWPRDIAARTWARCATAEMHSGFSVIRDQCTMNCGVTVKMHNISDDLQADIRRIDELWCEGIERFGGPFLAGDTFTAVDAFYAPVAFRVRGYGLPMSDVALSYVRKLLSIGAMMAWEEAALKETWREPSHEEDVTKYGDILEDRRAN